MRVHVVSICVQNAASIIFCMFAQLLIHALDLLWGLDKSKYSTSATARLSTALHCLDGSIIRLELDGWPQHSASHLFSHNSSRFCLRELSIIHES